MYKLLLEDLAQTDKLLNNVVTEANRFLSGLNTMPAREQFFQRILILYVYLMKVLAH
jgi:hypothetical protein